MSDGSPVFRPPGQSLSPRQKSRTMTESDSNGSGEVRGYDLARRALEEARAAAKANGKSVGQGRSAGARGPARPARRGWSGARPDERDPQPFGSLISSIAKSRGWSS